MKNKLFSSDEVWSEKNRDIAWSIISFSRNELKLEISPVIDSSFIILHHYFSNVKETPYYLYMLVVTATFLSSKIVDSYRPIASIFSVFSKNSIRFSKIKSFDENTIRNALGDRDFNIDKLTDEEISLISGIEIELLSSLRWNLKIDIPFNYFTEHKDMFRNSNISCEDIDLINRTMLRDVCLIIKSSCCLIIPPEVTAVAAVYHAFNGVPFTPEASEWIERVKSVYPQHFENAISLLTKLSCRCVKIRSDKRN